MVAGSCGTRRETIDDSATSGPEASMESLRRLLGAAVVEVIGVAAATDGALPDQLTAAADDVLPTHLERLREVSLRHLAKREGLTEHQIRLPSLGWHVWLAPVWTSRGDLAGAVVVARSGGSRWSPDEIIAIRAHGALLGLAAARDIGEVRERRQRTLDELVTRVAVRLMSVSRESLDEAVVWVLRTMAQFFDVDTVYFRRNDHDAGVSILVDEWPRRIDVPDPDPLGVVPFEGSDPVFAAIRTLSEPFVIRPQSSPSEYQERVEEASGVPQVSMAMVPLLKDQQTEGVLGFVNFRDREWRFEEINALQAIASLMMQLQARIDAEERLHHNAFHDELTGLANRRALFEQLERRLADGTGESVAAIFIDLDQFKGMNDVLGHGAGDRLLVATADRLRTVLRPDDIAARFGGDEFVVLLGGRVTSMEAFAVGDRLLKLVAQPVELNGQHVNRTASLGIAIGDAGRTTAEELLARSDAALYAAKARGRNQIVMFDDDLREEVDDRYSLEVSLRTAIDDGELRLFYQPEVNLRTGRLQGFEALVRWEHPVRGLLPAGAFITLAEDCGLVVDLGQWVLEEGARQLAAWLVEYSGVDVALRINVSPAQLMNRNLVNVVKDALERHRLPARRLCLEITEYAVMQDVERSIAVLDELRALGVELAIDDFGTGQSSMAQLKRLPVCTLKIDRSFVAGLGVDSDDRAIVDSIIRLAHAFGLEIVAEGVETQGQARQLLKLGCHRAQGYLFAKPLDAEHAESILAREATLRARARIELCDWAVAEA
jgi:diguanylate cyclase (GGDEF)-like protein